MRQGERRSPLGQAIAATIAALLLVAVVLMGWYQWSHRARPPIDMVKGHFSSETGSSVGAGIDGYIRSRGVEVVDEGFKPSWGAEETGDGVFTVAYVYEVGRDARWVRWRVDMNSGGVVPLDYTAQELWR